jgi:hypothetical protein
MSGTAGSVIETPTRGEIAEEIEIIAAQMRNCGERMTSVHPALLGDSWCFRVTEAGERFIERNSPKPPRLTKSQERGARWREFGDMFDSFRAFLRYDTDKARTWNGGPG